MIRFAYWTCLQFERYVIPYTRYIGLCGKAADPTLATFLRSSIFGAVV